MFTFVYILVSEHKDSDGKNVTCQLPPMCLNEESATAVSQPQFVNHHPFNPSLAPVHSELLAMYAETIFLRSGAATKQYPEVFQDDGGVFPRSWIHRPKPTRAIHPSISHSAAIAFILSEYWLFYFSANISKSFIHLFISTILLMRGPSLDTTNDCNSYSRSAGMDGTGCKSSPPIVRSNHYHSLYFAQL